MNNKRGSILVVTLGFILIFTLLGLGSIFLGAEHNKLAEKRTISSQAFWLAEAGIQKAIWKVNNNTFTGFVACGVDRCLSEELFASNGSSQGEYTLTLKSGNSVMTSTGAFPGLNSTVPNTQKRSIRISSSPFEFTLFGKESVELKNGDSTDSYNSSKLKSDGTPCGWNEVCADGTTNNGSEGDIGTNGTGSNAIDLGGSSGNINGQVSTGSGGGVLPANSTPALNATHSNDVSLPLINVPGDFSAQNSVPSQSGSAPALLAASGDFQYKDITGTITVQANANVRLYLTNTGSSISLGNNTQVEIKPGGSLTVFAKGGISANNNNIGLNNLNQKLPKNFMFFSTGNSPIVIKNNSNVYMAIYAPNADIDVSKNNGDTFGSFIGKTVTVKNNNAMHYDQDLVNYGGGVGNFVARNWQEF